MGGGLPDRTPFCIVGVEQGIAGFAAQHGGDFPREVLDILHAGVQAEATGWRHLMGGVAGQKHWTGTIALRDQSRRLPRAHAKHLDLDIRRSNRPPDNLGAERRGELRRCVTVVRQ